MQYQRLGNYLPEGASYGIVQPGSPAPDGVPIVRAGDIEGGRIATDEPLLVEPSLESRFQRTRLKGGELLLSVVGTPGKSAIVPKALAGWNVARAVAVIRPTGLDTRWLHYCFSAPEIRAQIDSLLNTTVQATLNLNDIKRLLIPSTPQWEQQAIAKVLGALDDKIAANSRLVQGVQQLSLAHYSRNANDTARLTDLARFVNGRNFTKEASGTGRVVIRIAELNSGLGRSTVSADAKVPADNVATPGDILFAWSGSLTLRRWMLPEAIVNQHIFKVIPNTGVPGWLVFQALRTQVAEFKAIAAGKATTMGHIQRKHLDVQVPVPRSSARGAMQERMQALWDLELAAEQESHTLAQLRDALLPALMDGRLRVRGAADQVEGVL